MNHPIIELSDKTTCSTYKRTPIVIVRGKGCKLWDAGGKEYTDFVAGVAVCSLGHAHPKIAEALYQQAQTLVHVSNLYYTTPQTELAAWLTDHSFADKVFFCNSGAEANEAAIKLARRYFKEKGKPDRFKIITMEKSFHGRTMGALSATGQEKIRKGFEPILEGFSYVPFNDTESLKKALDDSVCAVMLEPVQGEGGVRIAHPDYLKQVRRLCSDAGVLLIFDEVQTGMGRTGKLFAYEHFGVEPDIMTLAKALGNGLPIGAMLAKEQTAAAFGPGSHATTFGGTPLITAAALQVVKILTQENIVDHCQSIGAYFREKLCWLKERHRLVTDVRGLGLLLALELTSEAAPFQKACLERGFLVNCVQDNVLRFIPPLIIGKQEIDDLISCLDQVL
jgi:acetylornithine aminotransferase